MLVMTAIGMSGSGRIPSTLPDAWMRTVSRISAASGPGASRARTESQAECGGDDWCLQGVNGLDALLATVQVPPGVPVATVGIDNARNAAHLAIRILKR